MDSLLTTFLGVSGLALLDSLNPFSIAALVVVMARPPSVARGLTFVVATFIAYFLGGVLIANGWIAAIHALLPLINPVIMASIWGLSALAAWGAALFLWRKGKAIKNTDGKANPPADAAAAGLMSVFVFAVTATASDLPTALPLFGAIPLIVATKVSGLGLSLWLGLYCLFYVAPLMALLVLKLISGSGFDPVLARLNKAMNWVLYQACPVLLLPTGAWCLWRAVGVGA